jgi:DNA-directed RNA polymerase subunit M/transcription elongation factor TFIIS
MKKCPNCGYEVPKGRPQTIDTAKVLKLRAKGKSWREIGDELGVTHGAARAVWLRAQNAEIGPKNGVRISCPGCKTKRSLAREKPSQFYYSCEKCERRYELVAEAPNLYILKPVSIVD